MIKVAQQINATMSTKIALDLLSASESVKSLTAVVRSSQNAWKAQEAEMKSAGDAAGAAQARYEGLGKSIESQQAKIDALKSKQSELKGNTSETAQQFLKYQQQIDGATKQLASMQAQQDRAKQAMDYQKSGLAGLQQEYTAAARANQVYVERLQAEGREQEANKAKMEGYKSSISNLNEQLAKQSAELDKIANASGKDSDAWRTQKTRVDETATSLAKAKSSMTGLQAEMDKANPSVFNRVKEAISGTNKQAEKTPGLLRKIVEGGLITNAITSGWQTLKGKIEEATAAGMEYEKQQDQMNAVWLTLTGNATKGRAMVDMTNQLSVAFGQSTDLVNELNQQFYHVLDNEPATKKLTTAVLTMGDAVGLSGDNLKNLGLNFTHMMSSSLLQLGDFNHITDALPMYGEALLKYEQKVQKNSKLTMADLRNEMSAGKISAKDAETVMEGLGDKYQKASENLMKTIPGMERVITSRMPALIGDIEKPLMSMQNPILGAISKWAQDKQTDSEFTKLGKAVSGGLTTITGAFGKAFNLKNGTKVLDNMMANLTKGVTSISKVIANHAPQIKTFFETIKETSKTTAKLSWTALTSALKLLNPLLKTLGEWADKHPKLFGDIAGGLIAINLAGKVLPIVAITGFTKAVAGAFKGITKLRSIKDFGALSKLSSANGLGGASKVLGSLKLLLTGPGGIVLAIAAAGLAFYEAYKHIKPFHDAVNNVAKTIGNALKPALKAVISGMQAMWKSIQPILNQIGKLFKTTWALVVKVVQVAWKAIKPIVDVLFGYFKAQFDFYAKVLPAIWKGMWHVISSVLSAVWKVLKDTISSALKVITDILKVGLDLLSGNWGKAWSDIKRMLSDYWNGMKKIVSDVFGGIHNVIKTVLGAIKGVWNAAWSGMKSAFSDMWDGMKHAASDGMNAIINVINGAISGINWVWQKFTGKSALHKLSPVHFEQGGVVERKMHLVMVNDGNGPDWKELYQLPNGQVGMSQKRNATGLLPEGTRVFNGKETKAIMNMAGIEHYDLGGVIGGVGKFFSGAWDKLEAVGDWLANPVGKVTNLIKSSVSGISGGIEMFSNLASGVIGKLTGSVVDWFKKELTKLQDTLDTNPGGSGVQRWKPYVLKALDKLNLSTSAAMVAKVLTQIKTESGGNAKAMGGTDGLSDGHAEGLMQVKPGTFAAYSLKGHGNIWNGYDNMLAGLNYAKHRYGSSLSFLGQGHGYANGGIVRNWQYAQIAEHNKPEAVIPLEAAKDSRAWQVLKAVVDAKTGGKSLDSNNTATTSNTDSKIAELTNTVNQMAMMMKTIIGLNADQIAATKGIGTFDQNKFYKKMATDQGLSDYQSLA